MHRLVYNNCAKAHFDGRVMGTSAFKRRLDTFSAHVTMHSLFSDYISTQMAEGRDGNNHPVSSAVDALPSHFTDLTILQKGTSFPYTVPNLPVF